MNRLVLSADSTTHIDRSVIVPYRGEWGIEIAEKFRYVIFENISSFSLPCNSHIFIGYSLFCIQFLSSPVPFFITLIHYIPVVISTQPAPWLCYFNSLRLTDCYCKHQIYFVVKCWSNIWMRLKEPFSSMLVNFNVSLAVCVVVLQPHKVGLPASWH